MDAYRESLINEINNVLTKDYVLLGDNVIMENDGYVQFNDFVEDVQTYIISKLKEEYGIEITNEFDIFKALEFYEALLVFHNTDMEVYEALLDRDDLNKMDDLQYLTSVLTTFEFSTIVNDIAYVSDNFSVKFDEKVRGYIDETIRRGIYNENY